MPWENNLQKLIDEQFHKDNFLITTNSVISCKEDKYAAIYCSSNGVFREDTAECFQKSIVEKNNFEWYMNRFPYAEKHIFIRDISKRFYQFGINDNELNSFEKIADMIKKETQGYKIITIGSSSGGMAAIALGKLLNAEFTIAFSPMLKTYKSDMENLEEKLKAKEVFDATEYAKSDVSVFFVYPNGSEWDIYNSSLVKDFENVHFLPIKSNIHGVPINKRLIKKLLNSDKDKLMKIFKYKTTESVSEYLFARENWGWGTYLLRVFDYIKKYPLFLFRKDFYELVIK